MSTSLPFRALSTTHVQVRLIESVCYEAAGQSHDESINCSEKQQLLINMLMIFFRNCMTESKGIKLFTMNTVSKVNNKQSEVKSVQLIL